jgi:hypothetical protein
MTTYVLTTTDHENRCTVLAHFITAECAAAEFLRHTGHDIDHLAIADDLATGCTFEALSVRLGRNVVVAPNVITRHTKGVRL